MILIGIGMVLKKLPSHTIFREKSQAEMAIRLRKKIDMFRAKQKLHLYAQNAFFVGFILFGAIVGHVP